MGSAGGTGFDRREMQRLVRSPIPAIAILLGAMAVFGVLAREQPVTPGAAATPVTSPAAVATSSPVPVDRDAPGTEPVEGPTADSTAQAIEDRTGSLVRAQAGAPTADMTVRWGEARIEHLSPTTVRVTWLSYPEDPSIRATLTRSGDDYRLTIAQRMPAPGTDAVGRDRVLVLEIDRPISTLVVDIPM
jgi:hypothetical protein